MKGFNSPLKSKIQLQKFTKKELIDMYFDMCENNDKFIDLIINMNEKEFEDMKIYFNIIKNLKWSEE